MNYAIIAAGEGSRLHNEGFHKPKPMVTVNGETLIERLIRIFKHNNATSITIIINEQSQELKKLLESLDINIPTKILCKSTPSSLHSFYEIINQTHPNELCLTTVDTIFNENEFENYILSFRNNPEVDALMATSNFVDDEKPLWIETDNNQNILQFTSKKTLQTKCVSGGIYCLRNKAIQYATIAVENGIERMRNYQQFLISEHCNVKAYSFDTIIDIDHISDIEKADRFLNSIKDNNDILIIKRNAVFSPNSSHKDAAIIDAVCTQLQQKGHKTKIIDEFEILTYSEQPPDYVISMARHPQVLDLLESWEKMGTLVLNSAKACKNCYRATLTRCLDENIPTPKSTIISTKTDNIHNIHWIKEGLFWIKRADFQTMQSSDVIRPHTFEEANLILQSYAKRGIFHAVISEHIEGSLIKFYGVYGTSFFYWHVPKEDKFGNTINSSDIVNDFNQDELENIANCAAESIELDIYGGDAIIDAKGGIYIIDVNDFPSFSSCRNQASKAIVQHTLTQIKNFDKNGEASEDKFLASLKSEDTEEPIDIHFYRPIGYQWAKLAQRFGITPNMITITSIFIGIAAGILFYSNNIRINILGMFLLVLANSFDSADGQLARITNNHTRLGRILDGLAGDLWFITIYVSIALRLYHNGFGSWIWILASIAGVCHIIHASMADYYRNIHLYFVNGKKGSELDNSKDLTQDLKKLRFPKDFIRIVFLWFYRNYTVQQEFFSPKMQRFLTALKEKYNTIIPVDLTQELRSKNKPFMKYANILQFNTRVLFLFFCLFIDLPWLYFIFDIVVMNGILIYLIRKEEKFASYFQQQVVEDVQ